RVQLFARHPWGPMAPAMAACATLGWRATYIGSLGDDEPGAESRKSLTSVGVDVKWSRTVPGATNQFAVVIVDGRTGERTVLWHRDSALVIDPATVPAEAATAGRLLVVDCHETAAATHLARCARANRIPTIIDVE